MALASLSLRSAIIGSVAMFLKLLTFPATGYAQLTRNAEHKAPRRCYPFWGYRRVLQPCVAHLWSNFSKVWGTSPLSVILYSKRTSQIDDSFSLPMLLTLNLAAP